MRSKKLSLIFSSLVNVARAFINPLFIAAISYVFIHAGNSAGLLSVNKILVSANAFLVFAGWGLKDYLTKDAARNDDKLNKNWNLALQSKLILLPVLGISMFLIFPQAQAWLIFSLVLLRMINFQYEPLIVFSKNKFYVFLLELSLSGLIVLLAYRGTAQNFHTFMLCMIVYELIKLVLSLYVFKIFSPVLFKLKEVLSFLANTKYFFLLAVISFFQSKIDLYILIFSLSEPALNEYQLISAFISFSYIIITSFSTAYSRSFYSRLQNSEVPFKKTVLGIGLITALFSSVFIYLITNHFYNFKLASSVLFILFVNISLFSVVLYQMHNYTLHNQVNKAFNFVFIAGIVNLTLSLLLIKKWMITGALISNSAGILSLALLLSFCQKKKAFKQAAEMDGISEKPLQQSL